MKKMRCQTKRPALSDPCEQVSPGLTPGPEDDLAIAQIVGRNNYHNPLTGLDPDVPYSHPARSDPYWSRPAHHSRLRRAKIPEAMMIPPEMKFTQRS